MNDEMGMKEYRGYTVYVVKEGMLQDGSFQIVVYVGYIPHRKTGFFLGFQYNALLSIIFLNLINNLNCRT